MLVARETNGFDQSGKNGENTVRKRVREKPFFEFLTDYSKA